MPTTIALPQPRTSPSQRFMLQALILGVPLAVWAILMLLVAISVYFDAPVMTLGSQELAIPF